MRRILVLVIRRNNEAYELEALWATWKDDSFRGKCQPKDSQLPYKA